MASPEVDSRLNQILIPAFEKIITNASRRKGHSKLAHQRKSLIDRLSSSQNTPRFSSQNAASDSPDSSSALPGPLHDSGDTDHLSLADSVSIIIPLISACSSNSLKIADSALVCVQKLISHNLLRGEADLSSGPAAHLLSQFIESVCKCHSLGDDTVELLVLKTLLSAVTSTSLRIHGDCLLQIIRACYDLYLLSKNPVNQTTAKASLIQMLVIVFRRMEAGSSTVPMQPIVVAELMEPPMGDKVAGAGPSNLC